MAFKSLADLEEALGLTAGRLRISDKPHVALSDKFRRVDDEDTSTLFCSCGAHFEWEGFDNRLDPWLLIHTAHVETKGAK